MEPLLLSFETFIGKLVPTPGNVVSLFICSVHVEIENELKNICSEFLQRNTGALSPEIGAARSTRINIKVVIDRLDEIQADVLACTMADNMDLKHQKTSAALLRKAGSALQLELHSKVKQIKDGEIVVLKGENLSCKHVMFGVLLPFEQNITTIYKTEEEYYRSKIHCFMMKCLEASVKLSCSSIAFPAIGTGQLQYPLEIVADQMFKSVDKFKTVCHQQTLKGILFVVYHKDINAIQVFQKIEKKRKIRMTDENTDLAQHDSGQTHPDVQKPVQQKISCDNPKSSGRQLPDPPTTAAQKSDTKCISKLCSHTVFVLLKHFQKSFINKYRCRFKDGNLNIKFPVNANLHDFDKEIEMTLEQVRQVPFIKLGKFNVSAACIDNNENVCCIENKEEDILEIYGKTKYDILNAIKKCLDSIEKSEAKLNCQDFQFKETDANAQTAIPNAKRMVTRAFSWSADSKFCTTYQTKEEILIKVYSADILNVPVKCIVNAANVDLDHGGGVAESIRKAAGKELVEDGQNYIKRNGQLKVGEVCSTTAGRLPYCCVIHAVGPCWSEYKPHAIHSIEKCEDDLHRAILNSLLMAEQMKLETIAFPAISSGIYGCPLELCCVQYARAVLDYSSKTLPQSRVITEIHFVDQNENTIKIIQDTFTKMITKKELPYIFYDKMKFVEDTGDRLSKEINETSHHTESPDKSTHSNHSQTARAHDKRRMAQAEKEEHMPHSHFTDIPNVGSTVFQCKMGPKQTVLIYTRDIFSLQNIDIIACCDSRKGKGTGLLTQHLQVIGKSYFQLEKEKAFKKMAAYGDIVMVKGCGEITFKWVAHVILYNKLHEKDEQDRSKKVKSVFVHIWESMKEKQCHSVALPLLGTGTGNVDPSFCTERLFESLVDFVNHNNTYQLDIHLVHTNVNTTQIAIDAAKCFKKSESSGTLKKCCNSGHNVTQEGENKGTHILVGTMINKISTQNLLTGSTSSCNIKIQKGDSKNLSAADHDIRVKTLRSESSNAEAYGSKTTNRTKMKGSIRNSKIALSVETQISNTELLNGNDPATIKVTRTEKLSEKDVANAKTNEMKSPIDSSTDNLKSSERKNGDGDNLNATDITNAKTNKINSQLVRSIGDLNSNEKQNNSGGDDLNATDHVTKNEVTRHEQVSEKDVTKAKTNEIKSQIEKGAEDLKSNERRNNDGEGVNAIDNATSTEVTRHKSVSEKDVTNAKTNKVKSKIEKGTENLKSYEKQYGDGEDQNALNCVTSMKESRNECKVSEKEGSKTKSLTIEDSREDVKIKTDSSPITRCQSRKQHRDKAHSDIKTGGYIPTEVDDDSDCKTKSSNDGNSKDGIYSNKALKLTVSEPSKEEIEICVICLGKIKCARVLKCGHEFCSPCIATHFKYKEACPTCGYVCGIITGDQPDGSIFVNVNTKEHCAGYEDFDRIEITYNFPNGVQTVSHPNPGKHYQGVTRTGYLPNNRQGKSVCAMLQVAFERRLIFTIGRSRTTGQDDVITWNDIHHKTDPRPNSEFGYPDLTYLNRVTDELAAKGVTLKDIPSLTRK